MATFTAGLFRAVDFTQFTISDFAAGIVTVSDAVTYRLSRGGDYDQFTGIFVYADGVLVAGSVFEWTRSVGGLDQFTISGLGLSVPTLQGFVASNNTAGFLAEIFSGDDEISGSPLADHLLGFGGDDKLTGNGGNDTLEGGAGNDDLDGGTSADRMLGGAGNDDYVVNNTGDIVIEAAKQGDDEVESSVDFILGANLEDLTLTGGATKGTGNALDNNILGNAGNNLLSGLAGNDFLQAGGGTDTLQGGIGNDQYLLFTGDENTKISELANQGIDTVINGFDYTLEENIENLTLSFLAGAINGTGNALNNVITGNGFDNKLLGEAGNDTLTSGGGKDTMFGGAGNDVYVVISGDELVGEGDSDGTDLVRSRTTTYTLTSFVENLTIEGPAAFNGIGNDLSNVIIGNTNNNFLSGADGNDSVLGNDGDDNLSGGTGDDTLVGGNGNDNLSGSAGADKLIGGAGNDRYSIDDKDTITEAAGGGIDTISAGFNYTLGANFENLTVSLGNVGTGNSLANVIVSDFGSSTLIGGAGNDTLDGSQSDTVVGGTDSMAGGTGNDVYIIRVSNNADTILTELLNQGIDRVESGLDWTLGQNFEDLLLRDNGGAINGAGNALNNTITGNTSANKLLGKGGNDTLDGGEGGNDTLAGGEGNDTYVVRTGDETITEIDGEGIDTVLSRDAIYTLDANVENLTLLDNASQGVGNDLANKMTALADGLTFLFGQAGNDTLIGSAFANQLSGGTDLDLMIGGGGNDIYSVDDIGDKIVEGANAGSDHVFTSIEDYILGANLEDLTLGGSIFKGTGNAVGNFIAGNSSDNFLIGLAGNDTLSGSGGKNTLVGGTGDDVYIMADTGVDEIQELTNQGIDLVKANTDYTLGANLENLTLILATNGTGNELNNLITGNGADNKLFGLGGNDTLNGNGGKDTLSGGVGDDLYIIIEDALGDPGEETIQELFGQGTDSVQSELSFTLDANVENLTLTGSGNISGTGNGLANILIGNSGNNNLFGGAGADKMMGGAGNDLYSVDDAKDVVVEAAKQGTDTVSASINYTLGANLENLWVADGKIGTGNSGANKIAGQGGNNTLIGAAGNDTLDGSSADTVFGGVDSMAGGLGNDVYILRVGNEGSTLTELAGQGIDRVESGIDWTLGKNLENLILREFMGNLNGTGNTLNNIIIGNNGNNILTGDTGNDTLDAGSGGTDKLQGGLGNDLYIVHAGGVTVVEALNEGIDSVKSEVSFILGANVENLTLTGSDDIDGSGNGLANILIGNSGDNFLFGGTGIDKMAGGAGNDGYNVDDAKDAVAEGANQGVDFVQTSVSLTLGANLENLHLLAGAVNGTGNGLKNQITGNSSGNILSGLAGNDELEGVGGADTLLGGAGNDLLDGGGGADQINTVGGRDRVTYGATADAGDVIIGFAAKGADQDFVDLDALFDTLGVASGRAARVSFVDTGVDVELRIDTDGVGGADLTLLTFKDMASTADLTVGNGSTDDVLVGT